MIQVYFKSLLTLVLVLTISSGVFAEGTDLMSSIQKGDLNAVKQQIDAAPAVLNQPTGQGGATPLIYSVWFKQPEITQYLLERGADVNVKNNRGTTALHIAVGNGNIPLVKSLIKHGANVKLADNNGYNAMNFAARSGNLELFKIIEQQGVDLHQKSNNNSTLLLWAAMGGNIKLFEYLESKGLDLKASDDDGDGALHWAASGKSAAMVEYLIKKRGFDIRAKNASNGIPMEVGLKFGSIETTKYFLENGIKATEKPSTGGNWLHFAVQSRNTELIQLLLDYKLDINATNNEGKVPLEGVVWSGQLDVVKFMFENGAQPNPEACKDSECYPGGTPLHSAAWFNAPILEYLIEQGAEVNAVDENGQTALHAAASGRCVECIEALLKNKAAINKADQDGNTPLVLALKKGKCKAAETLVENGADVNVLNKEEKSPLHYAAIRGMVNSVDLLIEKGAKVDKTDKEGKTAVEYASYYCNEQTTKLLVNNGAKGAKKESCFLKKEINKEQAVVWYLNHSGWAVKTQNHLLVFDYWQQDKCMEAPGINHGYINPEELDGLKVMVFSSHNHGDHYDESIFEWKKNGADVRYVMGFQQDFPEKVSYVADRTQQTIDGVKVATIPSTDGGQGFLVEADGVVIYHPGDHANGNDKDPTDHNEEIDFLKTLYSSVDIAFLPSSGCRFRNKVALLQGAVYTCENLKPAMVLPMHGSNNEEAYADFGNKLNKKVAGLDIKLAQFKGDRFVYKK